MFGPLRKPSRRLARVNRQATELRRRRGRAIFREELSRARFRELPDSRLMIRPRRAEAEIRGSIKQCDGLHNIWVCEAMPGRQKNERRDRKKTAKKNAARLLLRLHPDCAYSAGNWSRSDSRIDYSLRRPTYRYSPLAFESILSSDQFDGAAPGLRCKTVFYFTGGFEACPATPRSCERACP